MDIKERFKTQNQALNYFKQIINEVEFDCPFVDYDLETLFKSNPYNLKKAKGFEIKGFIKKRHPRYKTSYILYAILEDDTLVEWSYKYTIQSLYNPEKK